MTMYRWDKTTPANNATADATINWAEGQAPSSVNDSARGMMTAVAKFRDDTAGTITTGGTSTAYTLTSNQVFATLALMNGAQIAFIPHTNCGATVTLNVDTLGAKPLRTAPGVELAANSLVAGTVYLATYNNSSAVWYLNGVYAIPAANLSITTAMLADDAVTYAKIQNVTNARLLGNFAGSLTDVSEYAIAGGLTVAGSTLSGSMAVPGGFKNLVIKVASNTTVTVAADYVVMFDATSTRTVAISSTLNFANVGVVNGIDATGIAIDKEYHIWAISNGTTDGALASLSSTAPTMPSGYTWKARIGAVMTQHGSAILYGTWQLGRRTQYIVGLSNTTALPLIKQGIVGTYSTTVPTWSAVTVTGNGAFVPTTASRIQIVATNQYKTGGNGSMQVAPNASYGGYSNASGIVPPFDNESAQGLMTTAFEMTLEAATIQVALSSAGSAILCLGWEDNI